MIDRLIGSPEFVDHWTNKWADLLQVNRKFLGEEGAWSFRNWIRQALSQNMPYDQFVYNVLTASGSTMENPPASYYKVLLAGRRDGEHDAIVLGRAIQLQQMPRPSVRVAGRRTSIISWRLLCPRGAQDRSRVRRPQDRRHGGRTSAAAVGNRVRPGCRRSHARADRQGIPAVVPLSISLDRKPPPRPLRGAINWPIGSRPRRTLFRQELCEPHLELFARRGHHRADRRYSRRQSAHESRTARPADSRLHRRRASTCASCSARFANRASISSRRPRTNGTRTTTSISHMRRPAVCRPKLVRRGAYGDWFTATVARRSRGISGVAAPDSGVELADGFLNSSAARRAKAPASANVRPA